MLRTLATADFDSFVQQGMQKRKERVIERTHVTVEILPAFAHKLETTPLTSGLITNLYLISEEWKSPSYPKASNEKKKNES